MIEVRRSTVARPLEDMNGMLINRTVNREGCCSWAADLIAIERLIDLVGRNHVGIVVVEGDSKPDEDPLVERTGSEDPWLDDMHRLGS